MPRGRWSPLLLGALLLLVRSAFVAQRPARSVELALRTASAERAAACRDEGCGCPHEEIDAACCCVGREHARLASESRASDSGVAHANRSAGAALMSPRAAADFPSTTLAGFHCSGSGRSSAAPDARVPSLVFTPGAACLASEAQPFAIDAHEPGPPFDLRREPATPPPRPLSAARG